VTQPGDLTACFRDRDWRGRCRAAICSTDSREPRGWGRFIDVGVATWRFLTFNRPLDSAVHGRRVDARVRVWREDRRALAIAAADGCRARCASRFRLEQAEQPSIPERRVSLAGLN